jgi:hypothetical protein
MRERVPEIIAIFRMKSSYEWDTANLLHIHTQSTRREWAMRVDEPEVSVAQPFPYERIKPWISITVWTPGTYGERKELHDLALCRTTDRIPWSHDTWSLAHFFEPIDVILYCERNAVKDRRKAVVEDSV